MVVIITACQASRVNSSASLMFSNGNEVDTTKSLGKAADREKADFLLPVCVLEHAQTAVCRVQVFDGNKLFDVVSEGGNISIHLSNREGAKYVVAFYSADGYVPATIVLTPDMKPSDVNLNKATDPRLGYVSGVLVKTSSGHAPGLRLPLMTKVVFNWRYPLVVTEYMWMIIISR